MAIASKTTCLFVETITSPAILFCVRFVSGVVDEGPELAESHLVLRRHAAKLSFVAWKSVVRRAPAALTTTTAGARRATIKRMVSWKLSGGKGSFRFPA